MGRMCRCLIYSYSPQSAVSLAVATVRLRWEDPESHAVTEIEQSIDTRMVYPFEQASPRFQLDIAVAGFADLLGLGGWSQNASYEEILRIAEAAAASLPDDPSIQEFIALVQRARDLSQ